MFCVSTSGLSAFKPLCRKCDRFKRNRMLSDLKISMSDLFRSILLDGEGFVSSPHEATYPERYIFVTMTPRVRKRLNDSFYWLAIEVGAILASKFPCRCSQTNGGLATNPTCSRLPRRRVFLRIRPPGISSAKPNNSDELPWRREYWGAIW